MRKYVSFLPVLILLLSAYPALANSDKEEAFVVGIGAATCAEYTKTYQSDPEFVGQMVAMWSMGYISAMNQMNYGTKGQAKNVKPLSIEYLVSFGNRFCSENPLENWSAGMRKAYAALAPLSHDTIQKLDQYNGVSR